MDIIYLNFLLQDFETIANSDENQIYRSLTMFCWGNTVNGELGLGGIEENHILSPEEITNFDSINNIKSGMYH